MAKPKKRSPASNNSTRGSTTQKKGPTFRGFRPELAKVRSLAGIKLLQVKLFQELRNSKHASGTAIGVCESQMLLNDILTEHDDWEKSLNAAHEVNHKLNQLLPLIATDDYLYATLELELRTREHPEHGFSITALFDAAEISSLIRKHRYDLRGPGRYWPEKKFGWSRTMFRLRHIFNLPRDSEAHIDARTEDRRRAEQLLRSLYEQRDDRWTYERAVVRLRRYYLMSYGIVVGVLLAIACMFTTWVEGAANTIRDQLLLVTSVGALGSVLAATFKLRDAPARLNDLPAVLLIPFAQALIGATLGFVTWLILMSGVVEIGRPTNATWVLTLVAFAGGFSEPFTLRLIDRFIGSG
jgi:hypothetical protein